MHRYTTSKNASLFPFNEAVYSAVIITLTGVLKFMGLDMKQLITGLSSAKKREKNS